MISLYYGTDDRFCRYGINYFIKKFGIPVEINKPSQSGIVIAYGVKTNGKFLINIEKNEIKNSICGNVSTLYEKIPLCEKPLDTGYADEVMAHFKNADVRYPCVTQTNHGYSIGIDIFNETGHLLAGHLDSLQPPPDSTIKTELASRPTVDFLQNILFTAILAGCNKQQIPLVQKSLWPDGKRFAVCLTHDVDEIKKTYQWISRPFRFLVKRDIHGFIGQARSFFQKIKGKEPYYTYDDIISIEHEFGAKSTYFILKESGNASLFSKKTWYLYGRNRSLQTPEIHALIQRLSANGDEVAIHGSYFSYKDPVLLKDETRELEKIIPEKVIGTRQHNLNLDIPATWNHQVSAGLMYDTTLGFKDTIGFRWGTAFPFFPNTGEKSIPLLEIPLIIMDICLESRKNKAFDCLRIADEVERYQGVLTLLWHPPIFNTLEYRDERDIYINILQYCSGKDAWFARACDIFGWMDIRTMNSFTCDYDKSAKICKIIPTPGYHNHYFSLYVPPNSTCNILSGNAQIFRKRGDCLYIKTHNLQEHNEIIVGIA
jgi:glutaredoxin-related protein